MDLKISNSVKNTNLRYYANGKQINYEIKVDCSDGENPFGCSKKILEPLKDISYDDISRYSYDNTLKEELAKYWKIEVDNIILCCGSVEGIYSINPLFRTEKAKLLTFVPHFPNYSNHAKMLGYEHKKVYLDKEQNYKYDIAKLIKNIDDTINLIYIDNPNNPTGQSLDKSETISLIKYAEKLGIGVIIDEAYGDYLEKEESCIDLVNKYSNLIVARTFSKGFGLAGLRAGYLISNKKICGYLEKMSHPYNISQITRKLAVNALHDTQFLEVCKKKIEVNKERIKTSLPSKLKMASTNKNTSICLLYTDLDVDLCKKFAEKGIKVYSGMSFDGIGQNSIRMNLPCDDKMDTLINAIKSLEL